MCEIEDPPSLLVLVWSNRFLLPTWERSDFLWPSGKKRKRPVHILSHSRFTKCKCPLSFQPPASSSKWEEEEEELIALAYIWNPPICSVPFFFHLEKGGHWHFFPRTRARKEEKKQFDPTRPAHMLARPSSSASGFIKSRMIMKASARHLI